MIKALHNGMSVQGLNDLETLNTMWTEFFVKETYDWWRKVQPGDTVMDIGACVGMFTCRALDLGAKTVYAIEPNPELLRTTVLNALPHMVNKNQQPLYPINCFIGTSKEHTTHGFGDIKDRIETLSFKTILKEYGIKHIDYLKIDCEGGEYSIFEEENWDFLNKHVKHMAIEWHLDVFPEAPDKFIHIRDNFIANYKGKVRWLKPEHKKKAYDDEWMKSKWPLGWGAGFMMYLTN